MICPNCKKSNKCNCKNCNPDNDLEGVVKYNNQLYICYWCNCKFSPDESLDAEWSMMEDRVMESISPEVAALWANKRPKYLKEKYNEFKLNLAVKLHFGVHMSIITTDDLLKINRELKIKDLYIQSESNKKKDI